MVLNRKEKKNGSDYGVASFVIHVIPTRCYVFICMSTQSSVMTVPRSYGNPVIPSAIFHGSRLSSPPISRLGVVLFTRWQAGTVTDSPLLTTTAAVFVLWWSCCN